MPCVVICWSSDYKTRYIPETDISHTDYTVVVDDILSGQYERIHSIIWYDDSIEFCEDVTRDIAREVVNRIAQGADLIYNSPTYRFIEEVLSCETAMNCLSPTDRKELNG